MNLVGITLFYILETLGVAATAFEIARYRVTTQFESLGAFATLLYICGIVLLVSVTGMVVGKVFRNKILFRISGVLVLAYIFLILYMMFG